MSKKEQNQIKYIEKYLDKELGALKGAEMANLSERQFYRRVKNFKENGLLGYSHKLVGRKSNRSIKSNVELKIFDLIKEYYEGFGVTFIRRKLLENHEIQIAFETLRQILIRNNLKFKTRKKQGRKFFRRRRKEHEGEMAQIDGSEHIWFGNEYNVIVAIIDDATSKVTAKFVSESTIGCAETFKEHIKKFGIPCSLYSDHGGCYKVNIGKDKTRLTQFGRMLKELNVKQIFASTPQAKGRIERFFGTIQEWLPDECKLNNITTLAEAEIILQKLVDRFNSENTVFPVNSNSLATSSSNFDLESIFCFKFERKIKRDMTVIYKDKILLLNKKQPLEVNSGDNIEIRKSFNGELSLYKNNKKLKFTIIEKIKNTPKIEEKMSLADEIERESGPYRNPKYYRKIKKDKLYGLSEIKHDISNGLKR